MKKIELKSLSKIVCDLKPEIDTKKQIINFSYQEKKTIPIEPMHGITLT